MFDIVSNNDFRNEYFSLFDPNKKCQRFANLQMHIFAIKNTIRFGMVDFIYNNEFRNANFLLPYPIKNVKDLQILK